MGASNRLVSQWYPAGGGFRERLVVKIDPTAKSMEINNVYQTALHRLGSAVIEFMTKCLSLGFASKKNALSHTISLVKVSIENIPENHLSAVISFEKNVLQKFLRNYVPIEYFPLLLNEFPSKIDFFKIQRVKSDGIENKLKSKVEYGIQKKIRPFPGKI